MTLEVLVCTIDNGINNINRLILAPIKGVSYLISWQHSENFTPAEIPEELKRNDIKIVTMNGRGLSRNRNNAICIASADICLIADDDCTYQQEYFLDVIHTFQTNPTLDIATFKMQQNHESKKYANHTFNLKQYPKGYYVSSIEIAFRRTSVQGKLRFNELFGLGAPTLQSGEDNIFIHDALKMGLNCQFFPITIVEHNHPTTSTTGVSKVGVIMAEGAYIGIAYPLTAPLRLLLKAYRLNKANQLGFFHNLHHLIAGITYYHKQKR